MKSEKWGKDDLSSFIDSAQHNELATFDNNKKAYQTLKDVDGIYHGMSESLANTKSLIPSLLLLRSHSAYRGASRLTLSGQIPESFVLARSCLEYALYALHIEKNEKLSDIWMNRHKDSDGLKACRKSFKHINVMETLKSVSAKEHDVVQKLYERTIDFGGHPNELAVTSSLKIRHDPEKINFEQFYLVGDSLQLDHGIKSVSQIGLASLFVLRFIWKQRFDMAGYTAKMDTLKSKL